MAVKNNIMIVRHQLLAELVKLWKDGKLIEEIDRLPYRLSPKRDAKFGRCCVHKERAIWRYKSFPLLGLDMTDETDELTTLSTYATRALDRLDNPKVKDNIMCVIHEPCSSCVHINYEITNLCKGCVARSCMHNCPKDAIFIDPETSKAHINHSTCISCGICQRSCPYHAVVYIPVPCEDACPVKAISRDEEGLQHIDESKCIYCGKCMNACPFGAIFEISQSFDVLESIRRGKKVVAIVAPSILAQFEAESDKVYGAFKSVGFSDVVEVARGAMDTVEHEAAELQERLGEGQPFMTTSCCQSYMELVKKHVPAMKQYVSETPSPMVFTARRVRAEHPDAVIVFVGPCIAKRKEGRHDPNVDYVMTFEEIASIFDAYEIDFAQVESHTPREASVRQAHGFGAAGGVAGAVKDYLKLDTEKLKILQVSNLDKKNIALLNGFSRTGKAPAGFIEVMACEGGCITGPSSHNFNVPKRQFDRELAKQKLTY